MRNDLFVAHESIYWFADAYAGGKRVLDVGCGTGYGSHHLARSGAQSVLGLDIDARSVRFARRNFRRENLDFRVADCEDLSLEPQSFDTVVASNVVEHFSEPIRFLSAARGFLSRDGSMLVVVPPIYADVDLGFHAAALFHRSNFSIDGWLALFNRAGWRAEIFKHEYLGDATELDFFSPFRSRAGPADFRFAPCNRDEFYREVSISAVFQLTI